MACTCCGCCAGKAARRGLLFINFLIFILGLAFIGTGAVSIGHVGGVKHQVDGFCLNWCDQIACTMSDGCNSSDTQGCDCGKGQTTISFAQFSAPGGGLISVGVFSCLASFLGCFGATRHTTCNLTSYIGVMCLVILLQFAFGVAAAVAESPTAILMDFKHIVERDPGNVDWSTMSFVLPKSCIEIPQQRGNESVIYQPACTFDDFCYPNAIPSTYPDPLKCCAPECSEQERNNGTCKCVHGEGCISGETCLYAAFFHMLTPVAGLALATVCFEVIAVCFAVATYKSARRGMYEQGYEADKDVQMDTI